MTSSCSHNSRVLLLIETSREYGRGLLRGIYRYNAVHKRWQIEQQAPFYLSSYDALGGDGDGPVPRRKTRGEGLPGDVDGIIMRDYRGAPALMRRGIPLVFASYLHKDIRGSHRILPDDQAVGRMAAMHLLERGFRRFAFVGYDSMYWSRQRHESFARTIADAGYECTAFTQARDLRLRAWRKEQKVMADWLRTLGRPVGLMACNDDRARQAVDACATAGLGVPEEVAIVGVDNDEFVCNLSNPPISSIALSIEDAGYRAAALLDQLMKAKRKEKEREARTRTAVSVRVGESPSLSVSSSSSQIIVPPVTVVTRQSSDVTAIEEPAVAEAVQFIRGNCRRPIQVSDVLQQVPVSRRTLFDRFKRVVGCTVHQYIKRARVAQIEDLLLGTSYSIGEIADILGFSSSEHIAMYFRSVKGVNPHTFRDRVGAKSSSSVPESSPLRKPRSTPGGQET